MTRNISLLLFTFVITLLGGNSAWAQTYIGNVDNTTEYGQATSQEYNLGQDQKLHLEFTNYSDKAENYHNWLLMITGIDNNEVVLRADDWWWCGGYNKDDNDWWKFTSYTSSFDWTNFKNDMDGASVIIDVSTIQVGDYSHVVIKTNSTNNDRNYIETFKLFHGVGDIKVKVSVDHSHITTPTYTITNNASEFYDFTNASSLNSRFVGVGGGTGSWGFVSGQGYKNSTSGTRQFQIMNLHNGDQVTITYSGNSGTFNSTNAKDINGSFISRYGSLISDQPFYMTADGTLEVNIPRNLYIKSVEINKEWSGSVTPTVVFTTPSPNSTIQMTVGQSYESVVTTNPTQATPVYTSSNTGVATVDVYGRVTAVGVGNATITANLTVNNTNATSSSFNVEVSSTTTTNTDYDFQVYQKNVNNTWTDCVNDTNYDIEWWGYTINRDGIDITPMKYSNYNFTSSHISHPNTPTSDSATDLETHNDPYRIGVSDWGWYLRVNGDGTRGMYNHTGKTSTFYILRLHNGDKIKITYSDGSCTASSLNLRAYNSSTQKYEDVALGGSIANNTYYVVTSDGYAKIGVSEGTYIQHLQIQREGNPAMSFSPSSTAYELTSLNFTEPTLITQPAGIGVTYSSSDETIAKMGSEDGGPSDVMFIRPGNVTITATATIGGSEYSASYTILVKADDALFVAKDEHSAEFPLFNSYKNADNVGVLAIDATTFKAIPFMTMEFGNGSDIALVRDFSNVSDYHSSMLLDADGIQHMNYTPTLEGGIDRMKPTSGTFYVFKPALSGVLTIQGVKRSGKTNTVVLVDADATSGTTTTHNAFAGEAHKVTYAITSTSNITSGTTVNVNDGGTLVATLTFGEVRPEGNTEEGYYKDFTCKADASLSGYSHCTEGNNVNGNLRGGTFYTIVPKFDGQIEIAVILNAGKNFYILEDGIALNNYNGITVDSKYKGLYTFDVKANKSYKFYASGSTLGFYGFKFSNNKTYTSYPIVKTLSFNDNSHVAIEEEIDLVGGHTYYLYGDNNLTNGGDRQVFYLHGFTYTTNFKFPYKGVVMDGRSNTVDALGYYHVPVASTYTATVSGGATYSIEYKDKDGKTQATAATVNESGVVSNISEPGSYIVTASVESNGQTYKTYYVLTVPYSLSTESTDRISWKFNGGKMENREQLNANADDWAVYYKVRMYNTQTRALEYINVPVRANGIGVLGDNARYFDNTAGLLFKANAHDFGTTSKDLNEEATLSDKLKADPTQLEENKYITIYNGTSMTIPNLKAGQYVRVKWSRYSQNNGDQVTVHNVTDLNGTDMDGHSISIGAGGRVQDNGGTGYHEFKVAADGDVTFTASQDGWINIYEVDVANQFIPTNLRLQTVDNTAEAGSVGSTLSFIRKDSGGSSITNEYTTAYGRILCQSNVGISYYIKGDPNNNTTGSRTGTLNTSNCTVSSNTLNLGATGHGRFTLVQEGKIGNYVLDRNEYEIKVYEYNYPTLSYPRTWNMENMSTATGTALVADSSLVDGGGNYKTWKKADTNMFKLTLEPENVIAWTTKSSINGSATAISELNGLGIRPADITKTNSIVLGSNNTGIELSSTETQILTVPSVASGTTAYIRVKNGSAPSVSAQYADGTEATLHTIVDNVSDYSTYYVDGADKDIDFYLKDVTVMQTAVSIDTKAISAAGYATEARSYPVDYNMTQTFLGQDFVAYKITGVSDNKVISTRVHYVPANAGVMITGNVTSAIIRPLFTTDVNREASNMDGNLLVGLITGVAVDQTTVDGGTTYYNYILANKGYKVTENGDAHTVTNEEVTGLGYYLLYKSGTVLEDNTTYTPTALKNNSAYLRLNSFQAIHQSLNSGSNAPTFCFFLDFNEATAIDGIPVDSSTRIRGEEGVYYTLQGVRVEHPGKGLYIYNGRKVFIK